MKLLRLATLYFPHLPDGWRSWRLSEDGVGVHTLGTWEAENHKVGLLIVADVDLVERPEITADKLVRVPEAPRKRAEAAIETSANFIAVARRCTRSISSPMPYIALLPEEADDSAWLEGALGFDVTLQNIPQDTFDSPLQLPDLVAALGDRTDGTALLAEALAHRHPTGKFHELMRLFERAFGCGPYGLINPLSLFLDGAELGYTRPEVERWVVGLRHPATHADRRDEFVLESDIRPVILRMEQAGYDVLFNKSIWRDRSTERRSVWVPSAGSLSADYQKHFRMQHNTTGALYVQIFDGFFSYPLDLSAPRMEVPDEWWAPYDQSQPTSTGTLEIKPATTGASDLEEASE